MDYSVGSLADLISGKNTPNKPKVIKKKFKKESSSFETDQVNLDPKIKKEPKKEPIQTTDVALEENSNKKKKFKNKQRKTLAKKELGEEGEEAIQSNKKTNLKKRKFDNPEQEIDMENVKQKKTKKRKLDTPTVDNVESEEDESTKPKELKLSKNEVNAERRIKNKDKVGEKQKRIESPEVAERTIFIGNIPIQIEKKKVKRHFKKYGQIESIRIRGIPVADPKVSKKVASIKKEFNPKRNSVYCYIRFANKEDAKKAEAQNGVLFEGHRLRVHVCSSKEKPDETKAIFVGNLSFDAEEDELWKLFETCGPISYVRIIRDSRTGMGKGFAYVNFKDADAVQLALEMDNIKLRDRELRISLCNLNGARKKKNNKNKNKAIARPGRGKPIKNRNQNENKDTSSSEKQELNKNAAPFQGTKFSDKKKKHKVNKGLLQKKRMTKKLIPKNNANE